MSVCLSVSTEIAVAVLCWFQIRLHIRTRDKRQGLAYYLITSNCKQLHSVCVSTVSHKHWHQVKQCTRTDGRIALRCSSLSRKAACDILWKIVTKCDRPTPSKAMHPSVLVNYNFTIQSHPPKIIHRTMVFPTMAMTRMTVKLIKN